MQKSRTEQLLNDATAAVVYIYSNAYRLQNVF